MNKQRLAILIAAGLGALATFMPWVNAPLVGAIAGTKSDGWITFGLFAIPMGISLLNDKSKRMEGTPLYGAFVPAIIAGLFGLWKVIDFNSLMGEVSDNPFAKAMRESISIGFGLYLVILAGIAVPVLAYVIKDK